MVSHFLYNGARQASYVQNKYSCKSRKRNKMGPFDLHVYGLYYLIKLQDQEVQVQRQWILVVKQQGYPSTES